MKSDKISNRHIFLTGFMGSGKSTIGKELARKLNMDFIDTDELIESNLKSEIKDIFGTKGEAWFRKYEEKFISDLIEAEKKAVISLGGGSLISGLNLDKVLSSGILIYIKSSPSEIWNRIKHSTRRPLLRAEGEKWTKQMYINKISELMSDRQNGYQSAEFIIDRDGLEVSQMVELILGKLPYPTLLT